MSDDADIREYRALWAVLADRSPSDVYIPEGLRERPSEPPSGPSPTHKEVTGQ